MEIQENQREASGANELEISENINLSKTARKLVGRIALALCVSLGGNLFTEVVTSTERPTFASAIDYPWAGAVAHDAPNYEWWIDENMNGKKDLNGELMDLNGYYYRNCTSYVGWRVKTEFNVSVSGLGNGGEWDDMAQAYGYSVDNAPEPGDAAVWDSLYTGDPYGHVAYVESVNSDGTVNVSEYNFGVRGGLGTRNNIRAHHYVDFNGADSTTVAPVTPTSHSRSEMLRSADFTGDGFDDVYATGQRGDPAQNEIVHRGGNWLGTGALWGTPPDSAIKFADSLNFPADINGDGKDDLITITNKDGEGAPNIQWQKSTGNSFETPLHVGSPYLISRNTRWAAGDVTGDGKDDIIAFSKGHVGINMFVFRSLTNWIGGMEFWGATDSNIPFMDSRLLVGDYNGDGKEDLYAIAKHADRTEPFIYRLKSNGQNFEAPVLTAVPGWRHEDVNFTAVDLDADGKSDLMASAKRSDTAPNLVAFLSDGDSSYKVANQLWGAPGDLKWSEAKFIPADLDNDGDKDLIAVQSSGINSGNPQLWWIKNNRAHFEKPVLVGQPGVTYDSYHYGY